MTQICHKSKTKILVINKLTSFFNPLAVYYSVTTSSERKYPAEGLLLKSQIESKVYSPTYKPSDDLRFGIFLPSIPYSEPLDI